MGGGGGKRVRLVAIELTCIIFVLESVNQRTDRLDRWSAGKDTAASQPAPAGWGRREEGEGGLGFHHLSMHLTKI